MLTDNEIITKYGQPGDPDNLTSMILPYPMRIAWDLSKTVSKIQCHRRISDKLQNALIDIETLYGYDELKRMGIDLFGGCLNVRLMRGSKTKWSRHSWGIAIDLDPVRNGLKVKKPKAQFSKPEYKPMIDIFYQRGFIGYGPEKNYDWMHFEIRS